MVAAAGTCGLDLIIVLPDPICGLCQFLAQSLDFPARPFTGDTLHLLIELLDLIGYNLLVDGLRTLLFQVLVAISRIFKCIHRIDLF